jgi:dTDP-4-amino-4,6-dideoxygalactose transaminase
MPIPFNKLVIPDSATGYIQQAIEFQKLAAYGKFTRKCQEWLEKRYSAAYVRLTKSCTHAIEMALLLEGIGAGDEVILPSFTYCSVANAVVQYGATPVFVDSDLETMNVGVAELEKAVSDKTRAIIAMHYGGVACDMDAIVAFARTHNLIVIEDAAQAVECEYKNRMVGTIGDYGCFSFHDTKNITSGEGGALFVNKSDKVERAQHIWERGTNRTAFWGGQAEKYVWLDVGTSYAIPDVNAAILWSQLECIDAYIEHRRKCWKYYHDRLGWLPSIRTAEIPAYCKHNGHIFYIILESKVQRDQLITYLKQHNIQANFHYHALHDSPAGKTYGKTCGTLPNTSLAVNCLLRLPLYNDMAEWEQKLVVDKVLEFFNL